MPNGKSVVAAGHEVTAAAAAEILQDGGNAFDAAIAGMLTACVAEAVLASAGGGGFMLALDARSGRSLVYDFFTATPLKKRRKRDIDFRAIHADFGPAKQEFYIGAGSTATPGFVPGLFAIHADLCRLPMRRLVEPAQRAAREGVVLTPFQAYLFTVIAPILTATESARALFAPEGRLLQAGETFRTPGFADMLDSLARERERLFTKGDVGRAILAQMRDGGQIGADDLEAYYVERRAPLSWTYRNARLSINPAPAASGPLIVCGLALLEAMLPEGEPPNVMELARVMASTNEARASLGVTLAELAETHKLAEALRALSESMLASRGTTHISIIDAEGNTASASISNGEGNGSVVDGLGFMLNNMLGEEDLAPDGFQAWQEGMRLSSMMAPAMLVEPDGSVTALGSGGSNRIRTAILQVLVNLLDRRMGLSASVDAPRIHLEKCGTLSFEPGLPEDQIAELLLAFTEAQAWPERSMFFGGVHAVRRHADGSVEGAGDPRRCGVSLVV
jgi:gamma-glutamyltranspeptidase / glutathione hydrolase